MQLVSPVYHAAVRRSLRVFPTSPTYCILAEAGLPSIQERIQYTTMRLIPKLFMCYNNILLDSTLATLCASKVPNRKSTILRCLEYAKKIGLTSSPRFRPPNSSPPWHLQKSSFLLGLTKYGKANTCSTEYQRYFEEYAASWRNEWKMLFTDGSKSKDHTSFAVVLSDGSTAMARQLPHFCSVYTAEAAAIYNAIMSALKTNEKTIICSDSKSTITSIMNVSNKTCLISSIRSLIIENQNLIKIMWIPGHAGIKGNELADQKAKEAATEPLYTLDYMVPKDIFRLINEHLNIQRIEEWNTIQHNYTHVNPTGTKPNYPTTCRTNDISAFIRLRIGHTIITHSHILKGLTQAPCSYCSSIPLTTKHLLDDCTQFTSTRKELFVNQAPSELLRIPSQENIRKIIDYLIKTDLRKCI